MRTPRCLLATLAVVLASCSLLEPDEQRLLRALTAYETEIVRADNHFGLRLFRTLSADAPDENLFVSPLSVSMALGMTLNGAAGETRAEMEETLALHGLTPEQINTAYRSLIDLLRGLDPAVAFSIANAIFHRQGFTAEPDFIDVNRRTFDAEVQALDFGHPSAVTTINDWVDDKTQGKIESIIDVIGPDVVMYLINAIYFKGTWTTEFDEAKTADEPFHLPDGSSVTVPMMRTEADFPLLRADGFSAVELPYGNGQYAMTLLLPDPAVPLDSLVAQLGETAWTGWTSQFEEKEVAVHLPRFKLEYKEDLKDVLTAMGMGRAFIPGAADFSGINPDAGLYISEVLHKTFVEVDEKGTEAAAVTAVEVAETAAPSVPTLRFDRPFVFAIRERHSGTLLFIGQVLNPA